MTGENILAIRSLGMYAFPEDWHLLRDPTDMLFFESAEAALAAGFQPMPASLRVTERVAALLLEDPRLSPQDLALQLKVSVHQVVRAFKKHTGMTPRAFARLQQLEMFKTHIAQGKNITTSLYDAGFDSLRALYERSNGFLGMQPRVYQQGGKNMTISHATFETPFGAMLMAVTDLGVCNLQFGEPAALLNALQKEYPKAALVQDEGRIAPHKEAVLAYLSGKTCTVEVPLDVQGTDFQWKVWQALRRIPHGETRSYAQVAEMLEAPRAVRAVARACASNSVALIVPCHRVVRSDGSLSGYRWGPERKEHILSWEHQTRGLF